MPPKDRCGPEGPKLFIGRGIFPFRDRITEDAPGASESWGLIA